MTYKMTYGELIELILKKTGFTRKQLRERLGIDRTTLWKWERGIQTPHPTYNHFENLARATGIPASEIIEWLFGKDTSHITPDTKRAFELEDELISSLRTNLENSRRSGVWQVGTMKWEASSALRSIDRLLPQIKKGDRRYEFLSLRADFLIQLILACQLQKQADDSWEDVVQLIYQLYNVGKDIQGLLTDLTHNLRYAPARATSIRRMACFELGNVFSIKGRNTKALHWFNLSMKTDIETPDSGRTVALRGAMIAAAHLGDTVLVDRYKTRLGAAVRSMSLELIPSCYEAIARSTALIGRAGESDAYYVQHRDSLSVLEEEASFRLPVRIVQGQLNLLARGVWFADPSIHRDMDIEATARNIVRLSTRHGYLRHAEMAVSHFAVLANLSKEEAKILLMPRK